MILGYCRTSLIEPASRLDRQKRALADIGAQRFFCDTVGLDGRAPGLELAIETAQAGDVLAITRPYRVARSTRGVMALIDRLGRKGVGFRILNTPVDTGTTTGRMILGSVPLWSLGLSPARAMLWDLTLGWTDATDRRTGAARSGQRHHQPGRS
jgi:DNA invertase Pin-like site-specific DNA recombinase